MDLHFKTIVEEKPGEQWRHQFAQYWPAYQNWFLKEGIASRDTYLSGMRELKKHMPEIVPLYESLCELAGGDDLSARFLSFYNPPPYLSGCSQAVWLGKEPMLVRNYDYDPRLCDGVIMNTAWNGQKVIAISDGMWGVVDGMNESGLAVSLTFGGRRITGDGFGVPLILRYILEFCQNAEEAKAALIRIPCHMAYNVTCVDNKSNYFTAYLSPDRDTVISNTRVATNHQENVEWQRHATATATVEREQFLLKRLTHFNEPAETFIAAFLRPPLYSTQFSKGFGTLYTSVYWPCRGIFELHWPGQVWRHHLSQTTAESRLIKYPTR